MRPTIRRLRLHRWRAPRSVGGLFRGDNLGANTVASQTAGSFEHRLHGCSGADRRWRQQWHRHSQYCRRRHWRRQRIRQHQHRHGLRHLQPAHGFGERAATAAGQRIRCGARGQRQSQADHQSHCRRHVLDQLAAAVRRRHLQLRRHRWCQYADHRQRQRPVRGRHQHHPAHAGRRARSHSAPPKRSCSPSATWSSGPMPRSPARRFWASPEPARCWRTAPLPEPAASS